MFKKYYKEANDDIKTNRELIDKIFEAAEKPQKQKSSAKIYKIGLSVAAVLVVAVSVSVLPMFGGNDGDTVNQPLQIAVADNQKNSETAETEGKGVQSIEIENKEQKVGNNDAKDESKTDKASDHKKQDAVLAQRNIVLPDDRKASGESVGASDAEVKQTKPSVSVETEKKNADIADTNNSVGDASEVLSKTEQKEDIVQADNKASSEQSERRIQSVKRDVRSRTSEKDETEQDAKPVEIIVPEKNDESESSGGGAVMAMETGESQGFSIARGVIEETSENMNDENVTDADELNGDGLADTPENVADLDNMTEVNENESGVIGSMLTSYFGEKDEATGHEYIFEIAGKDENVYVGRWRWMVDGHSSLLTEFVITSNMTEMYEYVHGEDGEIHWSTENNLLAD